MRIGYVEKVERMNKFPVCSCGYDEKCTIHKDNIYEKEGQNWCGNCHYSSGGKHGCSRLMDNTQPKIDISKGIECTDKKIHWLEFKQK